MALLAISFCTCSKGLKITTSEENPEPSTNKFSIKVYIENSGSMNGYMCNGAKFKDALYSYLTALNVYSDTMQLNYVNSQIVPLTEPLNNLINQLNPPAFAKAGGNTASSNFKQILSDVIDKANEATVVVFTSDCILDTPQGAAAGFLNITQTDINNTVVNKMKLMPTLSICIYQLNSNFNGTYYYPKGGYETYNGSRPYYMWIIGSQKNLAYISRNVPNTKIQHGVNNYCAFSPTTNFPNALYSGGKMVKQVDLKSKKDGQRSCKILMDLSMSLQSEEYISNPTNYFTNSGNVTVQKVEKLPITNNYSHLLTLNVADMAFSDFLILKSPTLPQWVITSNGDRDDVLEVDKTFSIKHIIGGVAEAYEKFSEAGKVTITTSKR